METKINTLIDKPFENYKKSSALNFAGANVLTEKEVEAAKTDSAPTFGSELEKTVLITAAAANEWRIKEKSTDETDLKALSSGETSAQEKVEREKFHWKPALIQSGIFLGIQHGYRMTQQRTRRELGGPFFPDWTTSVKGLRGWKDGDNFVINYVLHPLQGGLTGRIFVSNSDRAKNQEFGKSKEYWQSRFKAMVWSTVWSTQFELGPVSEASLGNVGIREKLGRSNMAYVDLVVTPTLGTGVLIGEDAIDKYLLKNWLERNARRTTIKIRILRSILTPTFSVSNMLRGKVPWKRDNRLLK
jgi:hypothetical protein